MQKDVNIKTDRCKHCGHKLAYITNSEGEKIYEKHSWALKPQYITTILSARWGL